MQYTAFYLCNVHRAAGRGTIRIYNNNKKESKKDRDRVCWYGRTGVKW